ncbi:CLCA_X family protein [Pseudoalteromonas sp. SSDWG2]|uniref:CLCA_X family protein n=1 Tax=Pseudoalteromonas sp. SSDWG2 TaxID=3139391 RepID=UPI003BAB5A7F
MTQLMAYKYRNGPDYRFSVDVDFTEVRSTFGLKAISVGRWVTKEERQHGANLIYDALADLTQILCIPPQVIGLRETLTLAFGQGGQLGVQAHYHGATRTLALAKHAGSGALAHEWWHAFDHYICPFLFQHKVSAKSFASKLWLTRQDYREHPLNEPLLVLFRHLFLDSSAKQSSDYVQRSAAVDSAAKQLYFAMPEELAARAFEHYIQANALKNHYLVSGTKRSKLAKLGVFPTANEAKLLAPCFSQYFTQLGHSLSQQRNA